jgi:CHAT domain-containing protein
MKTQAITGQVATKAEILQRMPSSRVIHLATHAILDESQGLRSAIALSASSPDNGWLTASEILDLKLSAELVVLSACNTGRGRITGDGFIGLSSSVILSGASSAIVSLWSIPDSPTAFLMKEFYRHLQQNPDKAQALRQAMLTTMKKRPALRDWAAFTLIGEAE